MLSLLYWVLFPVVLGGAVLAMVWPDLTRGMLTLYPAVWIDGKRVPVWCHHGAALPVALGHNGVSIGPNFYFRSYPPAVANPGMDVVSVGLAAHELAHYLKRREQGFIRYWARTLAGFIVHPFNHNARPSEKDAFQGMILLLEDRYPGVDAEDFLRLYR